VQNELEKADGREMPAVGLSQLEFALPRARNGHLVRPARGSVQAV
jgi:hypothetical protein